jgi:4-amino-4-deoxy-L-arabinose transferase-like glycosyltransferase
MGWYEKIVRPGGSGTVRVDVGLLLGAALVIMGAGLGLRDPWPADEPRFALVARDMVHLHEWLIPQVGGDLYPDKPPLFFWIQAFFLQLTGSLRVAFLFPSLCAGLGCILLVYDLARRLWDRETGFITAATLLLTFQFFWQFRQAQIDALLCFWTTLSLYGLLRHILDGPAWRWYYIGWAAAGLGVITKGVGFLPLLILVPYALINKGAWQPRTHATGAHWYLAPLAFLVAVSVWLVPMLLASLTRADIAAYRDDILFQQTVHRYARAWHHREPFWYFIVNVIPGLWLPLTALLPWTVPHWRNAIKQRDLRILLLLAWVAMVILFFSASPGKRGLYVIPAIPALALASGPALVQALRQRGPQRLYFALAIMLALLAAAGAIFFLMEPARRAELAALYGIDAPGPLLAVALGAAIACWVFRSRSGMFAYAGAVVVAMVIIGVWIDPVINASRSGARLVAEVEARTHHVTELGLVAYREGFLLLFRRPTVNFGHARWREADAEAADAAAWLAARPGRALLMDDGAWKLCFEHVEPTVVDVANDRWLLLDHGSDPACIARGHLQAARTYVPPSSH